MLVLPVIAGCADAVRGISDGPTERSTKIEELTGAIAARFTSPERSSQFEGQRKRLIGGALYPSRVFSDTSLWLSTSSPTFRSLSALGTLTDRGYRFETAEHPVLEKVGDTRHVITLRRIDDDEFAWTTGVDFDIGTITAADAGAMIDAVLTLGADREAATMRAGALTAFPRSAAVVSRMFDIDSLALRPGPQGTTTISMVLGFNTDRLRKTSPHFADYIERYVATSRYRFLVTDRAGAPFFSLTGADRHVRVNYRVRAGSIVSSLGPPRAIPDSLRLISDLSMRVKIFDVGWHNLVTDFTVSRTSRSRSWLFVAKTEPDWNLPLVTARLIRTSLRRPFQGAGASFEMAVIDSAGGMTVLARRARLEVKESQIMRFLSSLVTRVFDDLDPSVEHEEAAWIRELMIAFQQDSRGLLVP